VGQLCIASRTGPDGVEERLHVGWSIPPTEIRIPGDVGAPLEARMFR